MPQFLQPLDGNASDKRALLEAVTALTQQFQESGEQPGVYVADSGCFEGIDLHHTLHPDGTRATEVLRLTTVHRLALHLLGPTYETCYLASQETVD